MARIPPLGMVAADTMLKDAVRGVRQPAAATASFGEAPLKKLIVGIGEPYSRGEVEGRQRAETYVRFAPASLGNAVVKRIFSDTGVEDGAVHYPGRLSMGGPRLSASTSRRRYVRQGQNVHSFRQKYMDFRGVWCDRLLLGSTGIRSAVLMPSIPELAGESVELVVSSFPQLRPSDVLVVAHALDVPFGRLRLGPLAKCPEAHFGASSSVRRQDILGIADALGNVFGSGAAHGALLLGVGVGGVANGTATTDQLRSPLPKQEWERVASTIAPLASYCAALWTENVEASIAYANRPSVTVTEATKAMWSSLHSALPPHDEQAIIEEAARITSERGNSTGGFDRVLQLKALKILEERSTTGARRHKRD